MPVIANQPQNLNFLSTINFRFQIEKLPLFTHFVTNVTVPGLALGRVETPTPFVKIPRPGDHLIYDDLQVSFKMAEDVSNWLQLYDWMTAIGTPHDFGQYEAVDKREYSQASVVVYSSSKVPLHTFTFNDCFPVNLSPFFLAVSDTDVEYPDMAVTFAYRSYEVKTISTT